MLFVTILALLVLDLQRHVLHVLQLHLEYLKQIVIAKQVFMKPELSVLLVFTLVLPAQIILRIAKLVKILLIEWH